MAVSPSADAEKGLRLHRRPRGIAPGRMNVQLGRYRVSTLADFSALLARLPDTGRVRIFVLRDGQVGYTMLEW